MSATDSQMPPIPVMRALEMLRVTLARGVPVDGPYWQTPKGGKVEVAWMPRVGAYRFTIDLNPPQPFPTEIAP